VNFLAADDAGFTDENNDLSPSDHLEQLFPRLLSHRTLCFGATDVMSFLGRKRRRMFQGTLSLIWPTSPPSEAAEWVAQENLRGWIKTRRNWIRSRHGP